MPHTALEQSQLWEMLSPQSSDREQAVASPKAIGSALTTIFSRQRASSGMLCLHNPRCLYQYPLTATKFSFTSLGKWDIYQVRIQYHLEKFILQSDLQGMLQMSNRKGRERYSTYSSYNSSYVLEVLAIGYRLHALLCIIIILFTNTFQTSDTIQIRLKKAKEHLR